MNRRLWRPGEQQGAWAAHPAETPPTTRRHSAANAGSRGGSHATPASWFFLLMCLCSSFWLNFLASLYVR